MGKSKGGAKGGPSTSSQSGGSRGGRAQGSSVGRGGSASLPAPVDAPAPVLPLVPLVDQQAPPPADGDRLKNLAKGEGLRYVPNNARYSFTRKTRQALQRYLDERRKPEAEQNSQAISDTAWAFLSLAKEALETKHKVRSTESDQRRAAAAERVKIAMAALRAGTHGDEAEEEPLVTERQANEITTAVLQNNISKAMNILEGTSKGAPQLSEEDVEAIVAKHPRRSDGAPEIPPLPVNAPLVVITEQQVRTAILDATTGKAPGVDGWTFDMLQAVVQDSTVLSGITQLVQDIANGVLPADIGAALTSARVAALLKPVLALPGLVAPPPSFRPITMGSVFVKLTARIMKAKVQAFVSEQLQPVQRGEGTSNGVVSSVLFANAIFERHPDWVAADYDFANAFNHVERSLMFSKVFSCEQMKPIWRFVDFLYRDDSRLFLFDDGQLKADFTSSQGTRQGCVLGTLLFCLSTIDLLLDGIAATGVTLVSIADDVKAFGTQEQIYDFTTWMVHHARSRTDLLLQYPKSTFFYPNPQVTQPNEAMLALANELSIPVQTGGCWKMFGAAVGIDSEAKQKFVWDKVNEILGWDGSNYILLKKLESEGISAQVAFLIIRSGVYPKLSHIFRCFTPLEVEAAGLEFVEKIKVFISRKLVLPLADVDRDHRVFLPGDLGGFSLPHPTHIMHGAYLAAVAASMHLFVEPQVKAEAPKWLAPKPDDLRDFIARSQAKPFSLEPFGVGRALVDFVSFADHLLEHVPAPFSPSLAFPNGIDHLPVVPTSSLAYNVAATLTRLNERGVMRKVNQKGGILPDHWDKVRTLLKDAPDKLQQLIYRAEASVYYANLLKHLGENTRAGRLLQHSSEPFTFYWFAQVPRSDDSRLSDPEFRLAYAYRYSIDPYRDLQLAGPPIRCRHARCSHIDLRLEPFHDLHCPGESKDGRDTQHNRNLNHHFDFATLCDVRTERGSKKYAGVDKHDPNKRNNQRPDLVLHFGNGSVVADVRGIDPLCESALSLPFGKYAEYAGNAKVSKYSLIADREHCENVTPLVFTTLGGLGKDTVKLIDRVARNFKGSYQAKIKIKYQKITEMVVGIMKDNARMIQKSFRG